MMDSAENAGHRFTSGTVSFYVERAARAGRRSYCAGRGDVMSPGCLLAGNARLESLDAGTGIEDNATATLHDVVGPFDTDTREADPAEEAARNLDWQAFLAAHPPRHRKAILVLAEGGTMREAGGRCGLKDTAALLLKRRIAADLVAFFGADVIRRLLDGVTPAWDAGLRCSREWHLCNMETGATPALAEAG